MVRDVWYASRCMKHLHGVSAPHQFVSFDLLCYSRVPLGVAVGDTVLLRRMVIKRAPALHSDKPGYQEYLAKEGIAAAVFLFGGYQCRTVARPSFSPRAVGVAVAGSGIYGVACQDETVNGELLWPYLFG